MSGVTKPAKALAGHYFDDSVQNRNKRKTDGKDFTDMQELARNFSSNIPKPKSNIMSSVTKPAKALAGHYFDDSVQNRNKRKTDGKDFTDTNSGVLQTSKPILASKKQKCDRSDSVAKHKNPSSKTTSRIKPGQDRSPKSDSSVRRITRSQSTGVLGYFERMKTVHQKTPTSTRNTARKVSPEDNDDISSCGSISNADDTNVSRIVITKKQKPPNQAEVTLWAHHHDDDKNAVDGSAADASVADASDDSVADDSDAEASVADASIADASISSTKSYATVNSLTDTITLRTADVEFILQNGMKTLHDPTDRNASLLSLGVSVDYERLDEYDLPNPYFFENNPYVADIVFDNADLFRIACVYPSFPCKKLDSGKTVRYHPLDIIGKISTVLDSNTDQSNPVYRQVLFDPRARHAMLCLTSIILVKRGSRSRPLRSAFAIAMNDLLNLDGLTPVRRTWSRQYLYELLAVFASSNYIWASMHQKHPWFGVRTILHESILDAINNYDPINVFGEEFQNTMEIYRKGPDASQHMFGSIMWTVNALSHEIKQTSAPSNPMTPNQQRYLGVGEGFSADKGIREMYT